MKHLQLFEAASTGNLMDVKRDIFLAAKKKYIDEVTKQLKAGGITVKKVNMSEDIDSFDKDYFDCSYGKTKFKIKMSNRGVSLGTDLHGLYGYSVTVDTLVKKLEKLLDIADGRTIERTGR